MKDGSKFDGTAAISAEEMAEYMDLHFQLSGDCNMVEVTQGEQREDRGERAGFVGVYYRE